jgi:hypothetical protein
MKVTPGLTSIILLLLAVSDLSAATLYVSLESTNPTPPYTNWMTSATSIQPAVGAAKAGDVIIVTNGLYAGGVSVTNPLTLLSVNGPQSTVIDGGGTNRCVSLADGASLTGFTLTNGHCVGSDGGGVWCASTNAFLTNCVLSGNSAYYYDGARGGGAYGGTLYNSTLIGNWAGYGGGAAGCTLYNCTLSGNSAPNFGYSGGGAYGCRLYNCTLTGNSASGGGGAHGGTLYNCTLTGNLAPGGSGGGTDSCTLYNCALAGNRSTWNGGGAYAGTLYNCTLTGNSAAHGGGAAGGTLYNCIVYFNTAANGANYDSSTLNYCGTTPLPTNGVGNIAVDPQLASASHLSVDSACRGAGSAAYATGTDIDCEAWGDPPCIGCDEYHAGAVTGPLTVGLVASYANVSVGYQVSFTAFIDGRTTESVWDFGDGNAATNQPYVTHDWPEAGDYVVTLRAFNESQSGGVSASLTVHVIAPPVYYVAATSTNPQPPYGNWATAATNIQDAVDAAAMGKGLVLVTNGVYGSVGVGKPLTVLSVNGPQYTIINGGRTNRCVYLADGASLTGFTLTNGYSIVVGGGVSCASRNAFLTNCVVTGNLTAPYGSDSGGGAGASGGTLYDCTLTGNWAPDGYGGGVRDSTLYNCSLSGNSAGYGGGAAYCTLYNCTLTGNSAPDFGSCGGGAAYSTLYNCTLTGNSAASGGGACGCALYNCTLNGNLTHSISTESPSWFITGSGGGASGSTLYNCTLTGNSAPNGGGAEGCTLYNCIVYFNTALSGGANYDTSTTLNYCCTMPLPAGGAGNIALDPQLASTSHLGADSPCRGMGSVAYATGTDIDGEAWSNPPSIGCDEYHPGAVTGPLTVSLVANFTNTTVAYPVSLTALIGGRTTGSVWDFGDGVVVSNRPYASHAWAVPGDYTVVLRAYNESLPGGVTTTVTMHVVKQPVLYVAAASVNPQPPYASWASAATNIQDAVDATTVAGALVLVTNGVYAGGLAVGEPLILRSVNGPQFTIINGGGSNQCANLTTGASLTGFTLTNGYANGFGYFGGGVCCASPNAFITNCVIVGNSVYDSGGGAYGCTLYNCTLTRNLAGYYCGGALDCTLYNCTLTTNWARWGGGAYASTLYNCTLAANWAGNYGGGAVQGTLYNCMLTGNSAGIGGGAAWGTLYNCMFTGNWADDFGGGADGCTLNNCTLTGNSAWSQAGGAEESRLNNCILYFNTALRGANYYSNGYSTLNYCSTTPMPTNGVGNITNEPLFVDDTSGNLRLQSNSPCINAGNNAYVTTATDLDGNPRIANGTVDIGAYEYQGTGSVISYAWLQYYGLPADGSADYADPDHDGLNNWQEWICGTDPTDAASVLKMLAPSKNASGITANWESVNTRTYYLQRSTNLAAQPAFLTIQSNIVGQTDTTTCADTNATGAGPFFYRVGVEWP